MPGDGIGKTVLPETLRVLNAVDFEAAYVHADIGWEHSVNEGNALPQRTIELLERHKLGLFGAITSKPKGRAAAKLSPKPAGRGCVYASPIVGLRQHFDLDVCIRPCRSLRGNPLNFIRREEGGFEESHIDAMVFRQNTECLYAGVEWTNPPEQVRAGLETNPKMARFKPVPGEDLAVSLRLFSRGACRRIVREAFTYARRFEYQSVTVCEKPNVIRETSGMMCEEAKVIAKEYPEVRLWETNVDAQTMWLTKNPEDYGITASGDMFADIFSMPMPAGCQETAFVPWAQHENSPAF